MDSPGPLALARSFLSNTPLLYEHAEHVLRQVQRLKDEMAADTRTRHVTVSLGMAPAMQSMLSAPVATAFLRAYPSTLLNSGYPNTLRFYLEQRLGAVGETPRVRCEVNSASLLTEMIAEGAGVGIMPSCAIALEKTKELKILPI